MKSVFAGIYLTMAVGVMTYAVHDSIVGQRLLVKNWEWHPANSFYNLRISS